MSLLKLRNKGSKHIQINKAYISVKVYALGWRGGIDSGFTMGHYVVGHNIQNSKTIVNEWEKD